MLEINVASCSRSVEQPALPTLSLSPESQLRRQTLLEVEFLSTPTGSVDASLLNKEANSLGFTVITRMHLVVRTVESKHARNVWLTENGVTLISEKDGAISRGAFRWSSRHVSIHCQKNIQRCIVAFSVADVSGKIREGKRRVGKKRAKLANGRRKNGKA